MLFLLCEQKNREQDLIKINQNVKNLNDKFSNQIQEIKDIYFSINNNPLWKLSEYQFYRDQKI